MMIVEYLVMMIMMVGSLLILTVDLELMTMILEVMMLQ